MRRSWLALALPGVVSCAAPHATRAPPADFDTSVGPAPVLATGPVAPAEEDAGPARNPPDEGARDAGAVIVAPPEDAGQQIVERVPPPPPDTAPDQQVLVPEAWRACKTDADCALVGATCTTERVIAVNRRFETDVADGVRHACGAVEQVPGAARCLGRRCVATSPAPRPRAPQE